MTAADVIVLPPERYDVPTSAAWKVARDGRLRINTRTRRLALVHAASQCIDGFGWFTTDGCWTTVERLIDLGVENRGALFSLLVAACASQHGPTITGRLDVLVAS